MHTPSNWDKTGPGFDFFEESLLVVWQPSLLCTPPSSVLGFSFFSLWFALNKLFSALMANTIQSVGRSLFNLISRVLISSIHPLAAIRLTSVTPSPGHKESHLWKIRHPEKDQRCYLCRSKPRPSTACLMSGKLAAEAGGWLYTHQIHTHVFASHPRSCHEHLLSHAAVSHLCSCSALPLTPLCFVIHTETPVIH